MTEFAALALYPLWASALAVGLVALRLGRATRGGLLWLCAGLSVWVTGLILLTSGALVAERVLPLGTMLAGAMLHASCDVARVSDRRGVWVAYAYGAVVALLGAVAPRLLYGAGARSPGPLFVPVSFVSALGTAVVLAHTVRLALRAADAEDARRRWAMALACLTGALGGGGVIGLRVMGWGDVQLAAPLLLVAIVLTAYAVFSGESPRARGLLVQGAVQALVTAALSAFGLTVFYLILPWLLPESARGSSPRGIAIDAGAILWLSIIVFFAALPLEPLRLLVVERIIKLIFRRPINVPDLALEVEASEARADHAERLAELGAVVSAVAHEMRNPLGVIAAQLKLLERRGADEASVAAIRAQVDRARRFLDDLLRYGKPRPLEQKEIDVATTLALAVSNARQAFGAEAPLVAVTAGGAGRVAADRSAFMDVVTGIVTNACIAVSDAGPSADAESAHVRVTATNDEDAVVIVIEDDGPGVPAALEATLFQPFVTGRGRDAKHPGTGLGLAIAARWVERHGGSIRYARSSSNGARFTIRWPRAAQ